MKINRNPLRITSYNVCYTKLLRIVLSECRQRSSSQSEDQHAAQTVPHCIGQRITVDFHFSYLPNCFGLVGFISIEATSASSRKLLHAHNNLQGFPQLGVHSITKSDRGKDFVNRVLNFHWVLMPRGFQGISQVAKTTGRITSYNVCYTKLLRPRGPSAPTVPGRGAVGPRTGAAGPPRER